MSARRSRRLAAAPADPRRLLARAQHLRSVGRNADALAVLAPATRDVAAAAVEEPGMWMVNEAAYALMALDRNDEAVRLMERIAALPLDAEHPYWSARASTILKYLRRSAATPRRSNGPRGSNRSRDNMPAIMARPGSTSTRVCALAALGRAAETAAPLARLRGWSEINAPALTRAYLCLNDLDAAAALLVQRLGRTDPGPAILALQDYPAEPRPWPDRPALRPAPVAARPPRGPRRIGPRRPRPQRAHGAHLLGRFLARLRPPSSRRPSRDWRR